MTIMDGLKCNNHSFNSLEINLHIPHVRLWKLCILACGAMISKPTVTEGEVCGLTI